jgi:protein phosphatase
MGTTVVGAWICDRIASVAHVGDSRAYLWRDRCLEPLTRDHSLAEVHIAAGLADREGDVPAAHQGVLLRVLGREPDVDVEVNEVPVQAGDYVLLCSDGLTRMVSERELANTIADLSRAAAHLRSPDSGGKRQRRDGQHHGGRRGGGGRLVAPLVIEETNETRRG